MYLYLYLYFPGFLEEFFIVSLFKHVDCSQSTGTMETLGGGYDSRYLGWASVHLYVAITDAVAPSVFYISMKKQKGV